MNLLILSAGTRNKVVQYFKKECGETLTDYVTKMRMEYAAKILVHSDKQVQEIAEECGLLDANYFIKLFKKQYNMIPSQYRKYNN